MTAQAQAPRTRCTVRNILVMLLFALSVITIVGRSETEAAFPGANGDLVVEGRRDGGYHLWRIDRDGGNPGKLTTDGDNYEAMWSPDGTRIAFTRAVAGNDDVSDIWVMNADGSDQTRLTTDPEQDSLAAWSADGSKIAFRRGSTDAAQIWLMDSDGENETMIIDLPGTDTTPAFSPDGTRLAFAHRPIGGEFDLYLADTDGSNPTPLTSNSIFERFPSWSPDSSRIAYECTPEDDGEICVIDADGQNQQILTDDPELDSRPAWSPDGTLIVFSSTRSEPHGIFTMEPDGDNVQPVTLLGDFDPDWQPLEPPQQVAWGDHNCSDAVDSVDALLTLRFDAGLSAETNECPEMGAEVDVANASTHFWGDLDCSGLANSIDALKVLRHDAGLSVERPPSCPDPGESVTIR